MILNLSLRCPVWKHLAEIESAREDELIASLLMSQVLADSLSFPGHVLQVVTWQLIDHFSQALPDFGTARSTC